MTPLLPALAGGLITIGDPDDVAATGTTPVDFDADTPRWIELAPPGRHLLAVRFASRDVAAMLRVTSGDPSS